MKPPNNKKYPCLESTIELSIGKFQYRLWINETDINFPNPEKGKALYTNLVHFLTSAVVRGYPETVEFIKNQIPNLNALQISALDSDPTKYIKNGIVVYFVDFEKDKIHG